jgi:two-component system nitrogen regulation response regulator GlnG
MTEIIRRRTTAEPATFRLIAATNRSLEDLSIAESSAKTCISSPRVPIVVPQARPRDDIPDLARHFLARAAGERQLTLSAATLDELQARHWSGNVRELRAAMQYAAVVTRGAMVAPDCLPPSRAPDAASSVSLADHIRSGLRDWAATRAPNSTSLHAEFLAEFEAPIIDAALSAAAGNRTAAADLLGLHRETLRKKLGGGR